MTSRWIDCLRSFRSLPWWVRAWVLAVLIPVNVLPFLLLGTSVGRAGAMAALVVAAGNLPIMLAERGMSRLMAVPHLIAWIPLVVVLVIWLAGGEPMGIAETWLAIALVVVNSISLAFDAVDTIRWLRGQRTVPGSVRPNESTPQPTSL